MQPNKGRAVSNSSRQALVGLPLAVYEDGSQLWSFQNIDDLIIALRAPMFCAAPQAEGPINFKILERCKLCN